MDVSYGVVNSRRQKSAIAANRQIGILICASNEDRFMAYKFCWKTPKPTDTDTEESDNNLQAQLSHFELDVKQLFWQPMRPHLQVLA